MHLFTRLARTSLCLLLLLGASLSAVAQAPIGFNFQAVARDADNNILSEQLIAVRVSLLRGSETGPASFTERHEVRTSEYGVFDLAVGNGEIVSGSFDAVDWGSASYYLKIDLDPNGGSNYVDMGASELLSVPYALYANTAGNGGGTGGSGVGTTEDPTDELQSLIYDPVTHTLTITDGNSVALQTGKDEQKLTLTGTTLEISNGNTVDLSGLAGQGGGTLTEDQQLSFDPISRTLAITEGNEVHIPAGTDGDGDSRNEIQVLELEGDELRLTNGGGSVTLQTGKDEQKLTLTGTTLEISNGNTVDLSGLAGSGGGTLTEDQELTFDPVSRTLAISEGNEVHIPVGTDGDGDSQNEIQVLELVGNQLRLTNGGGSVILPAGEGGAVNTDNQELSFNAGSRELTIDGGNTVYIPAGNDDDADPKNELQRISLDGTTLILSQDGGTVELPGAVDTDDQTLNFDPVSRKLRISEGNEVIIPVSSDGDGDSQNEIQVLELVGNQLRLTNGGGSVILPAGEGGAVNTDNQELTFNASSRELSIDGGNTVYIPAGNDADADPTNELQDIAFDPSTSTLSITGGSSVVLPSGTTDADADPANEIQKLSLDGSELRLSNGGGSVVLPLGGTENTDNQELSFNPMNRQLSIEGGNAVYIPGEEDPDTDPTNELQTIYLENGKLVLTNGGGSVTLPTGGGDGNNTDELQQFTFEGGILSLSQDGGTFDVEGYVRPYITIAEEQIKIIEALTAKAAEYETIIAEQIARADGFELQLATLTAQATAFEMLVAQQAAVAAQLQTTLEELTAKNVELEARVTALENP